MNRPELYKKTVDILYQAYFDDTLEHHSCSACAVSNILKETADTLNVPVRSWANKFVTITNPSTWISFQLVAKENEMITQHKILGHYVKYVGFDRDNETLKNANLLIANSPYLLEELAEIEWAFETAPRGNSQDEHMFLGLSAVLDVLARIHEVADQDLITTTSKRFSDHYKTRSVCATNVTS